MRLSLIEIPRDDMVYQELLKQAEVGEAKPLPQNEDLPGMGQFYCLHCELVFFILIVSSPEINFGFRLS